MSNYNLFQFWRNNDKRGSRLFFEQPIAQWVCNGESFSWEESVADDLSKYSSEGTLLFHRLTRGLMFGTVAIAIWAAAIVDNFRHWIHFTTLLLVRGQTSLFAWSFHANPLLKIFIAIFSIARLFNIVIIGWEGIKFLAYTDNLKDFILNSVALGFIYDLPGVMFSAFCSTHEKHLVETVGETQKHILQRNVPFWLTEWNGALFMSLAVIITHVGFGILFPFSSMLHHDVYNQLCANTIL